MSCYQVVCRAPIQQGLVIFSEDAAQIRVWPSFPKRLTDPAGRPCSVSQSGRRQRPTFSFRCLQFPQTEYLALLVPTDRLLPPLPVRGHHLSLRGGCNRAATRHRPNAAPFQQPLHAHERGAGATQGKHTSLLNIEHLRGAPAPARLRPNAEERRARSRQPSSAGGATVERSARGGLEPREAAAAAPRGGFMICISATECTPAHVY